MCVLTGDFYVFFLHHYDEFFFGGEFFKIFFVSKNRVNKFTSQFSIIWTIKKEMCFIFDKTQNLLSAGTPCHRKISICGGKIPHLNFEKVDRIILFQMTKPRPIIAYFGDVGLIMGAAKKLAGTKIGISRDYPDMIRNARKKLEVERRTARRSGKKATIAFPAKLVVDGAVLKDELPGWNDVLRG